MTAVPGPPPTIRDPFAGPTCPVCGGDMADGVPCSGRGHAAVAMELDFDDAGDVAPFVGGYRDAPRALPRATPWWGRRAVDWIAVRLSRP